MDFRASVAAFRANPEVAGFILDFDGTLSPIVLDPESAALVEGGRRVLSRLQAKFGLVAMVSGRRAEDLFARVDVAGLAYLGLYGGEEYVAGKLVEHEGASALQTKASALAQAAETFLGESGLAGCRVEHKGAAVSVHFRSCPDPLVPGVLAAWAKTAATANGFIVGLGRKVVELRPAEFSKALAAERLWVDHRLEYLFLAGDDSSDVEAMEAAGRFGAHVFRVGVVSDEAPPGLAENTEMVVGSPAELLELLKGFAQ